ncbi:MAG: tRNA lysidine(34) synthetase TilS [Bryobacterales bacterium]|nr:tRNA lysidine(34) synthetase TilS [Bryobacterales bacterium]
MALLDRVRETISRYSMLPPPGPSAPLLGVALSGGGDSVALLHLLHRLGYPLHALHLNHLLRGAESDADESFVRSLCGSLSIPLTVRRSDPRAAFPSNLEAAGRSLRRAFFAESRAELHLHRIATGHSQTDQAETLLLRLLRGSSPRGLAAILPITRESLIRPLLDVPREEIRDWLLAEGLPFRDDATNADTSRLRARVRHTLLPVLARDYNPSAIPALARLASLAYEDERYWAALTRKLFPRFFTPAPFGAFTADAAALLRTPPALRRRLLRAALDRARLPCGELSHHHIARALAILPRASASATLPGVILRRSFHLLHIAPALPPPAGRVLIEGPGSYPFPGGELHLQLRVYNTDGRGLDRSILDGPLSLSGWKPGDGYRPLGAARRVKLTVLFQNARIPSWERPFWPILRWNDEIVWSRLFGPAAEFAAASDAAASVGVHIALSSG